MTKIYLLGGAHTTFIGKLHPDFIWKKHPDFGKRENPSLEDYMKDAVKMCLEETGVSADQVDRGFVGNFAGELFSNQGHLGAMLADCHPDLAYKPSMRVEGACASGGLAMMCGIDSIRGGGADVVLVAGAEVQTTRNAKDGADFLARASHYETQRSIDPFTFPCLFARRAKHVMEKASITEADLGKVVAKAYANANKNPKAHMHTIKVSEEDAQTSDSNPCFLSNEEYKPFLRLRDCSQVSDGGSALILCSEKGLEKLGKTAADAVEVVGYAYAAAPLSQEPELGKLETTAKAAAKAYEMAGLKPEDVQVAEVHDCFSVTEILMYEAVGFAEAGKGAELVREGATELTGKIPVNTGGGLIAFGHPVGATGVKQAVEIYRQLKGKCGDYQVASGPQVGLTANMGGDDRTSVVAIYKNAN